MRRAARAVAAASLVVLAVLPTAVATGPARAAAQTAASATVRGQEALVHPRGGPARVAVSVPGWSRDRAVDQSTEQRAAGRRALIVLGVVVTAGLVVGLPLWLRRRRLAPNATDPGTAAPGDAAEAVRARHRAGTPSPAPAAGRPRPESPRAGDRLPRATYASLLDHPGSGAVGDRLPPEGTTMTEHIARRTPAPTGTESLSAAMSPTDALRHETEALLAEARATRERATREAEQLLADAEAVRARAEQEAASIIAEARASAALIRRKAEELGTTARRLADHLATSTTAIEEALGTIAGLRADAGAVTVDEPQV